MRLNARAIFAGEGFALENLTCKQAEETEVVIYAEIGDMEALNACGDVEEHVQLEAKFEGEGRCRVRKTTKESVVSYRFTMKTNANSEAGVEATVENSVEVSEQFYEAFKLVASKGLVKTRYTYNTKNIELKLSKEGSEPEIFVIPNIVYEVDVYRDTNGNVVDWCKIDVEVDSIIEYLNTKHADLTGIKLNISVAHLPFKPFRAILSSVADAHEKEFIGHLWDSRFNRNPKEV